MGRGPEPGDDGAFEELARANPWPDGAVADLGPPPVPDALRAALEGPAPGAPAPTPTPRRGRRRGPVVAAAALVALVAAACGVAYVLSVRAPEQPASVACYAAASVEADTVVVAVEGGDPAGTCARRWEEGAVDPGRREAPALATCVLPSGRVAAFPAEGDGTCADLGLDRAEATSGAEHPVAGLRAAITAPFAGGRCIGPVEARALVEAELAARGMDGWAVVDDPRPARACATLAIDEAARLVTLVPDPTR